MVSPRFGIQNQHGAVWFLKDERAQTWSLGNHHRGLAHCISPTPTHIRTWTWSAPECSRNTRTAHACRACTHHCLWHPPKSSHSFDKSCEISTLDTYLVGVHMGREYEREYDVHSNGKFVILCECKQRACGAVVCSCSAGSACRGPCSILNHWRRVQAKKSWVFWEIEIPNFLVDDVSQRYIPSFEHMHLKHIYQQDTPDMCQLLVNATCRYL